MSEEVQMRQPARSGFSLPGLVEQLDEMIGRFPTSVTLLILRVTVAIPFWRSGLTKWNGFLDLSDSAVFLFAEEFKLHLFGTEVAYPMPKLMAFLSGSAEIILPLLLVVGLGTRFAALGILAMTAVIQLTIPDGWLSYHLPWAAMALALMTYGAGRLSADYAVARAYGR